MQNGSDDYGEDQGLRWPRLGGRAAPRLDHSEKIMLVMPPVEPHVAHSRWDGFRKIFGDVLPPYVGGELLVTFRRQLDEAAHLRLSPWLRDSMSYSAEKRNAGITRKSCAWSFLTNSLRTGRLICDANIITSGLVIQGHRLAQPAGLLPLRPGLLQHANSRNHRRVNQIRSFLVRFLCPQETRGSRHERNIAPC